MEKDVETLKHRATVTTPILYSGESGNIDDCREEMPSGIKWVSH